MLVGLLIGVSITVIVVISVGLIAHEYSRYTALKEESTTKILDFASGTVRTILWDGIYTKVILENSRGQRMLVAVHQHLPVEGDEYAIEVDRIGSGNIQYKLGRRI